MIVHDGGHARQRKGRLGDVVPRIGLDLDGEFLLLLTGGMGAHQHAVSAGFVRGLHYQLIQVFQDIGPVAVPPAKIGRHVGQDGVGALVVADHFGNVSIDNLIVRHAIARSIGQRHASRPVGRYQARDAQQRVGPECVGIQEIVVDAAVDHVHALQAFGGAHEDVAIVHHQVAALHQLHAHLLGQEAVLKIG